MTQLVARSNALQPCKSCDGSGKVPWTTPPHRGDPRYAYRCGACVGLGIDNPLATMTQSTWNNLDDWQRETLRDNSMLTPMLIGLEGHRVEVRDEEGGRVRRFIVGKSTGWRPIHLELARRDSSGGGPARKEYASLMDFGKVR